jgi:hypothetical protein
MAKKIPQPVKKLLKDASLAGLQGALQAPEGVAMDDVQGQTVGRLDQIRNGATAALLTGGLGLLGGKVGPISAAMGFAGGKGKGGGNGPSDEVMDALSEKNPYKDKNIIVPKNYNSKELVPVPLDHPPVYSDDYKWATQINMEQLTPHPNPALKGFYLPNQDLVLPGPSKKYEMPYLKDNFTTVAPVKPGDEVPLKYVIAPENKYFTEKGHLIMEPNKLQGTKYQNRDWTRDEIIHTTDNPTAIYITVDSQRGRMTGRPQIDEAVHLFDADYNYISRSSYTGTLIQGGKRGDLDWGHPESKLTIRQIQERSR